jgi:hypothetical protein
VVAWDLARAEEAGVAGTLRSVGLSSEEHREVQAQTRRKRNGASRYHLAQRRGQELSQLRRENALLKARLAAVRLLFLNTEHTTISGEDWEALRNALEMP